MYRFLFLIVKMSSRRIAGNSFKTPDRYEADAIKRKNGPIRADHQAAQLTAVMAVKMVMLISVDTTNLREMMQTIKTGYSKQPMIVPARNQ
ncbi:hypothetical protein PoB_005956400 [Plakobranchus ocellatus]|uniref:Uncharacterized protein n=1 Tax=Plakobranchus ocellatus TaxID=259542 RepID=A0AAV4CNB7_9GAST|nr:hypothetical protein PoB_005956400 [Plakobranchus ocellatus]